MKSWLLFPDRDFDPDQALIPNADDLAQDLRLDAVLEAMSAGDEYLRNVGEKILLAAFPDRGTVLHRREILRDFLENREVFRSLYRIVMDALSEERRSHFRIFYGKHPSSMLYSALGLIRLLLGHLKELSRILTNEGTVFRSPGLLRLRKQVSQELDGEFYEYAEFQLERLNPSFGSLILARLGAGLKGEEYRLRKPGPRKPLLQRLLERKSRFQFQLADRDEAGARALSDLRDRGLNHVADSLGKSVDHILGFLEILRFELGFYLGCVRFEERLAALGMPCVLPEPLPEGLDRIEAEGLYDASLALTSGKAVVANRVQAPGKRRILITGANQGGKSTLLRAIGLAQVLMQCGMPVPAERFSADLRTSVFTHFKRREDASLKSGKLDEELRRMSGIVSLLRENAMVLFNESFAATNEREGSEIARQIADALSARRVKVVFVTHLYNFARSLYDRDDPFDLFLRAERQEDGTRTYRVIEGAPGRTSYGKDLFKTVFGTGLPGDAERTGPSA